VYEVEGIVAIDFESDLALLKLKGVKAKPLVLADSKEVKIGAPVFVLGSPKGLEGTFSTGIVSSIRKLGKDKDLIQVTAPVSHGSSGGPVLDADGRVIGIAVATMTEGQNLNFAVPVSRLRELAAKIGAPRALRTASRG
jgi:S1-C subfamily serine protease